MQNRYAAALDMGSVGSPAVDPRFIGQPVYYPPANYVGDASVAPRYIGAPTAYSAMPGQQGVQPVQISPVNYPAGENSYFGMGSTTIPAGAVNQSVGPLLPQRPITPQRLGCPSTVQGLMITSAQIGGINLFASQLGVAIEMFSEVSTFPQMDWPTLEPSTGISFTVSNPTLTDLAFKPVFYGAQARR